VDINQVLVNNGKDRWADVKDEDCCAIEAISWTIQVDVEKGGIEKIVRQGDCILVKPKPDAEILNNPRHLTKDEYLSLIVAES
jgi:hypothetical protein